MAVSYVPPGHVSDYSLAGGSADLRKEYFLVADDSQSMRAAIAMQVASLQETMENLSCIFVASGEQAVSALTGERFQQTDTGFFPSTPVTPSLTIEPSTPSIPHLPMADNVNYTLDGPLGKLIINHNAVGSAASSVFTSPAGSNVPLGFTLDELNAKVSAVVMDCEMPGGINGLEATRRIRLFEKTYSDHPPALIYLHTASEEIEGQEVNKEFARKNGFDGLITKGEVADFIYGFTESLDPPSEEESFLQRSKA